MEKEIKILRPGEKEFIERFEREKHFEEIRTKEVKKEEAEKKIREYIEKLSKEIEQIPIIKKEAERYYGSLEKISNILAYAVNVALEEGVLKGLETVKKTGDLHLLDAYHDILAGYFFNTLLKANKIKIIS